MITRTWNEASTEAWNEGRAYCTTAPECRAAPQIGPAPTYQPSNLEDMREKLREEIANTGDT